MEKDSAASLKGDAHSPISVLEDEGMSGSEVPVVDAEDNDLSIHNVALEIPEDMAMEEKRLEEERAKREREEMEKQPSNGTSQMDDMLFNKLDELLSQTQLYSEFLLEKMDDITFVPSENGNAKASAVKKSGRGRKRKAVANNADSYQTKKRSKNAIDAMTENCKGDTPVQASDSLIEEEKNWKEQMELVPLLIGGRLKSYQIKGVKWLISLWQNGLNGILADQMGLGKTVQTIGLLAHLKGMGMHGPFLVVAPLSTLSNWVNEINRFVPSMNAIIYHGNKIERQELRTMHMPQTVGPTFPVIVTSYEVAMNDSKALARYAWKYLVVDEGHRLKNADCKLLRELKTLPVENKLLLTGTPLQNNLAELWSLLNFILPQIFTSREQFESWFDLSGKQSNGMKQEEIEEKRRVQVISKLHLILRPFLLRRLKEEVEQSLPRKKEMVLYADMTEHQKQIQAHLVNKTLEGFLLNKAGNDVLNNTAPSTDGMEYTDGGNE